MKKIFLSLLLIFSISAQATEKENDRSVAFYEAKKVTKYGSAAIMSWNLAKMGVGLLQSMPYIGLYSLGLDLSMNIAYDFSRDFELGGKIYDFLHPVNPNKNRKSRRAQARDSQKLGESETLSSNDVSVNDSGKTKQKEELKESIESTKNIELSLNK